MTLIFVSMLALAALCFLGGFFAGRSINKSIFKKIESGNISYWEINYYAERILNGVLKYNLNSKEKRIIKDACSNIHIIVKDKPFDPYNNGKGYAKFFISEDYKIYFTSDGNWRKRFAKTLAFAFKYALKNDPDSSMTDTAWFSYVTRLVED